MKQIVNVVTFIFLWLPMAYFPVSNEEVTNLGALQTGRNEIQQGHIMTSRNCAAAGLGVSSGRVILVCCEHERRSLMLHEIYRFKNGLHSQNGYVTWNVDSLKSAIRLRSDMMCEGGICIDSIGIDT